MKVIQQDATRAAHFLPPKSLATPHCQ